MIRYVAEDGKIVLSKSEVQEVQSGPARIERRINSKPGRTFGFVGTRFEDGARRNRTSIPKRTMDIIGALTVLILLSPLMLVVALLIRLEGSGPVLFRQERYGRDRRPFMVFKFRSMTVVEARGEFQQATRGDSRVTHIGKIIRATSIDELPQLFNVLAGDMSLVGPRPHAVEMDKHFAMLIPNYFDRYAVNPGMTGLAQVRGLRGPTDTIEKIAARVKQDRGYIGRWSLLLDLRILVLTPFCLLSDNAH